MFFLKFEYLYCLCVSAGYTGTSGGYSGYQQNPPDYTTNHSASYSGGLTEEEQIQAAIRNSLNDGGKGGEY